MSTKRESRQLLVLSLLTVACLVLMTATIVAASHRVVKPTIKPVAMITPHIPSAEAIDHLSHALRFDTSDCEPKSFPTNCDAMWDYLMTRFPHIHAELPVNRLPGGGVLVEWKGTDRTLPPILMLAHMDVVPAPVSNGEKWIHGPFSGDVADGSVWGRGAIDDKSSLVAMLEAVEDCLRKGSMPRQTIYLAFGSDEERMGHFGAAQLAEFMRGRGLRFRYSLDEGGAILVGIVPDLARPVASVGVTEKGFLTVRLTARSEGGHTGMPPQSTATSKLIAVVHELQQDSYQAHLIPPVRESMKTIAPYIGIGQEFVVSNLWLFEKQVLRQYADIPEANATVRTTMTVTALHAEGANNAIPEIADAVLNYRLMPADSVSSVLARIRSHISSPDVALAIIGDYHDAPSNVASSNTEAYSEISGDLLRVCPDCVVISSMVLGATDSRYYADIVENSYRITPIRLDSALVRTIHGSNEHLPLSDFASMIDFYKLEFLGK